MKRTFTYSLAVILCVILFSNNVKAQKVGIGSVVFAPQNMLDVKGGMVVGNTYSGVNIAPASGLLIEGNTGIGTVAPIKKLDVRGDIQVGDPIVWTAAAQNHMINFGDANFVYIGERGADDRMELRAGRFYFNVGNVGIGTAASTEKLDVVGNVKFSGALMPNNLPGTAGYILQSNGAGVAPAWNIKMTGIATVERWYYPPFDLSPNTVYTVTGTGVAGCTWLSQVAVCLAGDWAVQPNVTIEHVEARTGEIRFRITNNTLFTTYLGMDFNILVVR